MNYQFVYSKDFKKHYKNLSVTERKQVTNKPALLAQNPNHPSLRTKRVKGTDTLFESSVNMDIRIIWYYDGDKIIVLVGVGHHDILKQF